MSKTGSTIFRNERGAIDLASIMVGIIVIGLVGGVIAATVFAIIPWAQDKAAKQQLDSISTAQAAYKARSSDMNAASAGFTPNSYASSEALQTTELLQTGDNYCTVPNGTGYSAFTVSVSGKVFAITDTNTSPQEHTATLEEADEPGCGFLEKVLPSNAYAKRTTLTYKCDTTITGILPIREIKQGKLTITGSDGTKTVRESSNVTGLSATLVAGVEYKVVFDGTYSEFGLSITGSTLASCARSLDNWGSETGVTDAQHGFYGAVNLTSVPESIPPTVTNISNFFNGATIFNDPKVSSWDVSQVTDISGIFNNAKAFNQPLNKWDTSEVTNMNNTFSSAAAFNQPLDNWNTSKVTTMSSMFYFATKFNQPLAKWDVSKVTKMDWMFRSANAFKEPLNSWNVSNVTNMSYMFYETLEFNQPLNKWNVSKVTAVDMMFNASAFKQDLSSWTFNTSPTRENFSALPTNYLPEW